MKTELLNPQTLINNVLLLAKTPKTFKVPIILTTLESNPAGRRAAGYIPAGPMAMEFSMPAQKEKPYELHNCR